jgi:CheY-like chemotaxis protein
VLSDGADRCRIFIVRNALIVDDDVFFARVVDRIVRGCGFETVLARNVEIAMVYLEKMKFEVVVTDYNLGPTTGLEVVRGTGRLWPGVPVVVMSGSVDDVERKARAVGARAFVQKPFRLEQLVDAIALVTAPIAAGA